MYMISWVTALITKHASDVATFYQLQQCLRGQAAVTDQRFDFRWVETRPGHHQDALNPDQQRALEAVRQVRAVSVPSQVITLNTITTYYYWPFASAIMIQVRTCTPSLSLHMRSLKISKAKRQAKIQNSYPECVVLSCVATHWRPPHHRSRHYTLQLYQRLENLITLSFLVSVTREPSTSVAQSRNASCWNYRCLCIRGR